MSKSISDNVTCGACGKVSSQQFLVSSSSYGSPDLDLRRQGSERWSMDAWVQRCPNCGYCAKDISEFNEALRKTLESEAYRSQLSDKNYPSLAISFICQGMLHESIREKREEAWSYLHAAWVLEDVENDLLARKWRSRAADSFMGILANADEDIDDSDGMKLIIIDCLRRGGRGKEALPIIESLLGENIEENVPKIAAFQRMLIEKGDLQPYSIEDALE